MIHADHDGPGGVVERSTAVEFDPVTATWCHGTGARGSADSGESRFDDPNLMPRGSPLHSERRSGMSASRRAAVMYLIAALGFLIAGVVGLVGDAGIGVAGIAFFVLAIAFLILALNAWQSGSSSDSR